MFQIKPHISLELHCPNCNSLNISQLSIHCAGIQFLIDCRCQTCELDFFHTLPTGHALLFPLAFAKKSPQLFLPSKTGDWYYQYLLDAYYQSRFLACKIQKITYQQFDKVLIINCLDYLFGHSFLRLLNVEQHLKTTPEIGIVVIIPATMAWLVPQGVAEVWLVEVNFAQCRYWLKDLDSFFQTQIQQYEAVYLSYAFVQLDWTKVNIELFTRTPRFDLTKFAQIPPHITLIIREDRFWLRTQWEKLLFRISIRLGWQKYFKTLFCYQQNRRFHRLAQLLQRQNPDLKIKAVGLGKSLKISPLLEDQRATHLDTKTELDWCQMYSQSHLVVGVHGSNMLIPTALSAGFIELLSEERIINFAEDIALPYQDRKLYFFGRFLPETASPRLVAQHIAAILQGFRLFDLCLNDDYHRFVIDENLPEKYRE